MKQAMLRSYHLVTVTQTKILLTYFLILVYLLFICPKICFCAAKQDSFEIMRIKMLTQIQDEG